MNDQIHIPTEETPDCSRQLTIAKMQYTKLLKYRRKLNFLTFLFLTCLLVVSIGITILLTIAITYNYTSKINSLSLSAEQSTHDFEISFADAIIKDRADKVVSCTVSSDTYYDANQYIASLYRRPDSLISASSLMGESYYLITDSLRLNKYDLMDTSNNTIYPGAIIKGDSLFSNHYTVITSERTPLELMSNQTNGYALSVNNPGYSTVSTAVNQYATDYDGSTSKEWTYYLQSATSSQEFNFALGVGFQGNELGLDIGSSNEKSTIAVVYSQIYYTVSAEPKNNASDYFSEGTDLRILGDCEPAYVSSVDYGRKIVLIVSGTLSSDELSAKLNACIKGVSIGVGIENILKEENLECRIMAYGGSDISSILNSSEQNIGVVGEIKTWLWGDDSNGNSSIADRLNTYLSDKTQLINPVPISYCLKYLSDNSVVPPMYIKNESIVLADNVSLITLSADNNKTFTVDISQLPIVYFKTDAIHLQNQLATGTTFQFICRNNTFLPITILYDDQEFSIDLADCEWEKSDTKSFFYTEDFVLYKTTNEFTVCMHKTRQIDKIQ